VHDPRAYLLGGVAGHAGLFSTADDLAIVARMLLNEGKHGGKAFLQPETLKLMTAPRKVPVKNDSGLRTYGWDMATGYSSNRGDGFTKGVSYGHTGFTGTSIWIDPPTRTAVIFLSNRVHPDGKGNVTKIRSQVATIAAKAVTAK
jgi:CubicO group peptidase (beta-lactamase class C family)